MRTAVFLLVAMFATIVAASSKNGLDSGRVQQEIHDKGPKEAAATLFADKHSWDTLTKNVQSGKREWVDLAVRLRSGTDGGASSELHDALFAALATNPRHVLQVVTPTVPVKVLCSGRSDPLPTGDAALSEIARIKKSVGRLTDSNLVEQKKACLAALEQATTDAKRFFKD